MKSKHPRQFAEVKAKLSRSNMATSSQQQTLQQSLERREKYSRNSKQCKKLTNSVVYCIEKDMMPFSTVERQGFKNMLSVFDEKYDLPC